MTYKTTLKQRKAGRAWRAGLRDEAIRTLGNRCSYPKCLKRKDLIILKKIDSATYKCLTDKFKFIISQGRSAHLYFYLRCEAHRTAS